MASHHEGVDLPGTSGNPPKPHRRVTARPGPEVRRRALEAMTAAQIAAAILKAAEGVEDASKEDVQAVAQGIQHSLSNHAGKAWNGLAMGSQLSGYSRKWNKALSLQPLR